MSTERHEPSSPACLAHEADDAYMGFASRDEIAAFLNELLEAERAGAGVALRSGEAAAGTKFADLLHDVHHDEARWCAMLLKQLKALGVPASTRVGAFQDKALAIESLPERIAFLNRGQGWVVRKLREMLPKVRDDALHRDLTDMLQAHEANIARANEALKAGG
jgi:superfamily I DNA/RNA helicase